MGRMLGQFLCRTEYLSGGRSRAPCPILHLHDAGRHRMRALRRLGDVAHDLLSGRTLLLHRRGHIDRDGAQFRDRASDRLDRADGITRLTLDARDLPGDGFRRFGGLPGEGLHLAGNHREAPT